jgi:serine/threonine-protein kinase RsbW
MPDDVPGGSVGTILLRLAIAGTPDAVSAALHALFAGPDRLALPGDTGQDAQIVLAEAMNNIVEHAYADRQGQIDITLWTAPDGLLCRLVDNGAPMPDALPKGQLPDLRPDGDLPEGGFGWYLIRQLARDVVHRRMGGANHLTFRIPAEQSDPANRACRAARDNVANWP